VKSNHGDDIRSKFKKKKSGVFFYDPKTDRILLVKSRGMKWGPPKGSMEDIDNTIEDCAIREVYEETGIKIHRELLKTDNKYRIDRATYYYLEIDYNDKFIELYDNLGITWIKRKCLHDLINRESIELNSHCKKLLRKLINF
jgi:8-oxo-dGTP pyrophosphatase MutT (NUDIX family)